MQLRTKVISAAGIAAVVAAGGSAFTASSAMPNYSAVGYSNVTVTGLNVTSFNYTLDSDRDESTGVVFTTSETAPAGGARVGQEPDTPGTLMADVQLSVSNGAFANCYSWVGTTLTCNFATKNVNNINALALSYHHQGTS